MTKQPHDQVSGIGHSIIIVQLSPDKEISEVSTQVLRRRKRLVLFIAWQSETGEPYAHIYVADGALQNVLAVIEQCKVADEIITYHVSPILHLAGTNLSQLL